MMNTMEYRGYVASMTFDPEDKVIVGRVLDIDDITPFMANRYAKSKAISIRSSTITLLPARNWAPCRRSLRAAAHAACITHRTCCCVEGGGTQGCQLERMGRATPQKHESYQRSRKPSHDRTGT